MARFYGNIGYSTGTVEKSPGVWDDNITEFAYTGNVIRSARGLETGTSVNDDISVSNSISIVADAYANEHIFAMRYVSWQGALWKIQEVEVVRPRLLLRLGGVYNGPKA